MKYYSMQAVGLGHVVSWGAEKLPRAHLFELFYPNTPGTYVYYVPNLGS